MYFFLRLDPRGFMMDRNVDISVPTRIQPIAAPTYVWPTLMDCINIHFMVMSSVSSTSNNMSTNAGFLFFMHNNIDYFQ